MLEKLNKIVQRHERDAGALQAALLGGRHLPVCVLSTAEALAPTANFNESSSVPPTVYATHDSTTKAPPDPSPKPTPTPTPAPTLTQAPAPESCKEYTNCSPCLESKNATCFWTVCNGPGYCSENAATSNCAVVNSSSNCLVEPTANPSPTNPTAKPSPAASTTPAVTTVVTSGASNTAVIPTPSTRKSSFNTASFIGGTVLVLSVQAVVFFPFKFCKSKERNYRTL